MRMYAATKDTHCDTLPAAFFFCTWMPTLNVPPRLPLLILHGALIKHAPVHTLFLLHINLCYVSLRVILIPYPDRIKFACVYLYILLLD